MRTYQRRFYPSCRSCGAVITRGDCCDDCMAEQYSGDAPTCEAPGCTREVGSSEHLCQVHVALAAGEPPRLFTWQVDEVYRQLGDPAAATTEEHHVRVPGVGLVAVKRKRCEIDEQHVWFEWQAVAA